MNRATKKTVPALIIAFVLTCGASPAQAQSFTIDDLDFDTNPSNSPIANFLSGIPGNTVNDVSVGIAVENLCGQIIADDSLLVPATFNIFDLCFGVVGPVLAALDPEDTEFARFVEQSAGLLLGVSGQEVASLASSFTQLAPAGLTVTLERLSKLRVAQTDQPEERAVAFDSGDGALSYALESGGAAGDVFGERWRFYVNADVNTGDKDTTELALGYDLDGYSLDYRLDANRFVGLNLAASRVDLDYTSGSDGDVTTYDASAYGLWFRDDGWYLQGHAGVGASDIDLSRKLRFRSRPTSS